MPEAVQAVKKYIAQGEVRTIEGLWVTHYHEDHINSIAEFQKAFDCPVLVSGNIAQVIQRPSAWRLPSLSPEITRATGILTHDYPHRRANRPATQAAGAAARSQPARTAP